MKLNQRFVRFLRINKVLPPLDRLNIKVGDKVVVIADYLQEQYSGYIGNVVGFEDQTLYDDFVVKVEFPTIPQDISSKIPIFTEYFAPDELQIVTGIVLIKEYSRDESSQKT